MDVRDHKCLVVDDHLLSRQMVAVALKDQGIAAIDMAADGLEAMDKIRAAQADGAPYHIVLLDWSMPKMSGYEVLVNCRQEKLETIFVMISAESEDSNVMKAMKAGAAGYLIKPLKPEMLAKKLRDIAAFRAEKARGVS